MVYRTLKLKFVRALGKHLFACFLPISLVSAFAAEPTHLRLIDFLDRPGDGYCIDVHGTAGNERTDLPLFAHNCKQLLTSDSAVVSNTDDTIEFIELGLCVTVAGVNSTALPGAAVILRECGESTLFLETERLQQFVLHTNGLLVAPSRLLALPIAPLSP